MTQFLTTAGNSYYIEQIIFDATENLTLVTPILHLGEHLVEHLIDANKRNVKISILFGQSKLTAEEYEHLLALPNIEMLCCENLHAQCYMNERHVIITSMNLNAITDSAHRDIGIQISKSEHPNIFNKTCKEIESIKNASKVIKGYRSNEYSNLIYLSPDKSKLNDFYFPSLYRVLDQQIAHCHVFYDNAQSILVKNYPVTHVNLEVNGRINFCFDNWDLFYFIKDRYKKVIREASSGIRFYWKRRYLNIDREQIANLAIDQQSLETVIYKHTKVIEKTQQIIAQGYHEFQAEQQHLQRSAS